jgi:hypothetical protein
MLTDDPKFMELARKYCDTPEMEVIEKMLNGAPLTFPNAVTAKYMLAKLKFLEDQFKQESAP